MLRVFISFDGQSKEYADALRSLLESQSADGNPLWNCYYYPRDAEQGDLPDNLLKEISQRDIFVAIITEAYLKSRWCVAERTTARVQGKKLLLYRPFADDPIVSLDDKVLPPLFADTTVQQGSVGLLSSRGRKQVRLSDEAATQLMKIAADPLALSPEKMQLGDKTTEPYPGATFFTQEEAGLFFGRDDETKLALADFRQLTVTHEKGGVFVIYGASGSGKSSFMRAGILSRLGLSNDYVVARPFRPLQGPDGKATGNEQRPHDYFLQAAQDQFDQLGIKHSHPEGFKNGAFLATFLRKEMDDWSSRKFGKRNLPIVFSLDQGEELFSGSRRKSEEEQTQSMFDWMQAIVLSQQRFFFMVTVRSEAQFSRVSNLNVPSVPYHLSPLDPSKYSEVIAGPLRQPQFQRFAFEESSAKALMKKARDLYYKDDGGRATALPMLSFALNHIWRDKQAHRLEDKRTILSVADNFDLEALLDQKIQDTFTALQADPALIDGRAATVDELRGLLRQFFLSNFVDVDDYGEVRSRSTSRVFSGTDATLAEAFVAGRILIADPDDSTSYRLAHEAILSRWDLLSEWKEEKKLDRATFGQLRGDARRWNDNAREVNYSDSVYRRLEQLCDGDPKRFRAKVRERLNLEVENREEKYVELLIERHREQQEGERAIRRKAARPWIMGFAGLAVVTLFAVGGMYAWGERRAADADAAGATRGEASARSTQVLRRSVELLNRCWQNFETPIRPAPCTKFRLEAEPSLNGIGGSMSMICVGAPWSANDLSYRSSEGVVALQSPFDDLPGDWRFTSNGDHLIWSVVNPDRPTRTATYRATQCD